MTIHGFLRSEYDDCIYIKKKGNTPIPLARGESSKVVGGAFAPPQNFFPIDILSVLKFISFNFSLNAPPQILKFSS